MNALLPGPFPGRRCFLIFPAGFESVQKFLHALITLLCIQRHALHNDIRLVQCHPCHNIRRRRQQVASHAGAGVIRLISRDHPVQGRCDSVNVCPCLFPGLAGHLLRGRVASGAGNSCLFPVLILLEPGRIITAVFRSAKIDQTGLPVRDHDVGRIDVSVNKAGRMHLYQSLHNTLQTIQSFIESKPSLLLKNRGKRKTFNIIPGYICRAIGLKSVPYPDHIRSACERMQRIPYIHKLLQSLFIRLFRVRARRSHFVPVQVPHGNFFRVILPDDDLFLRVLPPGLVSQGRSAPPQKCSDRKMPPPQYCPRGQDPDRILRKSSAAAAAPSCMIWIKCVAFPAQDCL